MSGEPNVQPDPPSRRLALAAMSLGALALGAVVAGLVHRVLVHEVPHFYADGETAREVEMVASLPKVAAEPKPLGLLIGASTLVRLDPLLLDEHLRKAGVELSTYNLALDGSNADSDALLVARLREALNGRRASVAVLDVSLALATKLGRRTAEDRPVFEIGMHDARSLEALARRRPLAALDAGFRKYVLGELYYADVSTVLEERVLNGPWHCRLQPEAGSKPDEARGIAEYCAYEQTLLPDGYIHHWDLASHGFDAPAPVAALPRFGHAMGLDGPPPEKVLRKAYARHEAQLVKRYDFLDLDLDERSVETLVVVARELQTMSDHVLFLLSPENPLVHRSPEAEARAQALVTRLRAVSPVADLRRDPRFALVDFRDALHVTFAPDASERFASAVAEQLVPLLLRK